MDKQENAVQQLANAMRQRNIHSVVIAARGSSDNAARYAQYVLGANNRLLVTLATPSLFSLYHRPPFLGASLVLGISQSGRSPDIISVLAEARRQGALTAGLTNVTDSPLANNVDYVIDLCAGEEKAVAATKTYTATLTAVALLSLKLQKKEIGSLRKLAPAVEQTLALHTDLPEKLATLQPLAQIAVIGRGFNYATAFEIALKIKEMAYKFAQPYSNADFMHGPLALISPEFPVLLVAPQGVLAQDMVDFAKKLRSLQANLMIISDNQSMASLADKFFYLPAALPEWLSPITAVTCGQLLATSLAIQQKINLDSPRSIQKVTQTV
ncbi:MAG: SIS domain-containing protein [Chloroflexota bacterium]